MLTINAIEQNKINSPESHSYPCCLCSYFHAETGSWGYCELMNVLVQGNLKACKLSYPFFNRKNFKN